MAVFWVVWMERNKRIFYDDKGDKIDPLWDWLRIPRTNSIGKVSDSSAIVTDNFPNSEDAIRRGEYAVIRSLIRVLEGGVEGKRQVDKVIDKCASMQNFDLSKNVSIESKYRTYVKQLPLIAIVFCANQ
ncbi:unnamed protein product [Prunus armeniaca]|uniref:Uncharacterized protein n=1 Tax=Prunus armeniaca TaxID=36596 RepID=A0A6J5U898_PRUAR|nr:unnamed protein product [Prunus armeniaca]